MIGGETGSITDFDFSRRDGTEEKEKKIKIGNLYV